MAAKLNHTIVWCHDQEKSATFLTEILDLPPPRRFMGFLVVDLANDVSVDYLPAESGPIPRRGSPAASTVTSAAAASTSKIPTGTCSRSSRRRTATPPIYNRRP